jgi:hypothetical protein
MFRRKYRELQSRLEVVEEQLADALERLAKLEDEFDVLLADEGVVSFTPCDELAGEIRKGMA